MRAAASRIVLRILLLALLSVGASGLKLRVYDRECMTKTVGKGERVSGSYVSIPGGRGMFGGKGLFKLEVKNPVGGIEVTTRGMTQYKFDFEAEHDGRYSFCLTNDSKGRSPPPPADVHTGKGRGEDNENYTEVLWDLHVGHHEAHDKAQNEHVDEIWDNIDSLEVMLDKLQSEQAFQRNLEAHHKKVSTAVNKQVINYAVLRGLALIGTSVGQVFFIRWLFSKRNRGYYRGMLG